MKLRPLNDYALIKPAEQEEKSFGGIYLPENAKEKPRTGEVIAVGPGHYQSERDRSGKETEKKYVKTVVKPGDRVMFEKYGETKVEVDGEEYLLVREENILGYVE
ncbi:MAG TPA: co-chaperone GroES [Nitrospiria bacterium]